MVLAETSSLPASTTSEVLLVDRHPPRPSPMPTRGERWLTGAGLASLVLLAVGLRLIPIVFVPSMVWATKSFKHPSRRIAWSMVAV